MRLVNRFRTSTGFIFLALMVILPGQLADAEYVVLESATMGLPDQTYGAVVDNTQFIGARFYIDRQLEVTQIGGHITQWNFGANFFGAIVSLSSSSDLPNGNPFTVSEVVASTVFDPGYPSSDYRTPLSVTLSPGYYGLVFGTNALGSTNGYGIMPYGGQTSYPQASYFGWWPGSGWWPIVPNDTRFVIEGNTDYCDASGSDIYQYIMGVEVGSISNIPTGNSIYADYTSMSTAMMPEVSYPITVTRGNPWSDEYDKCGVWVDWNQDEDFYDVGEEIVMSLGVDPCTFTGTITPPADAVPGDRRMRVRIVWNEVPQPCGGSNYGEVEDYTINVYTTTMRLEPIADAYVTWDDPNTNYGTETKLRVGEEDYYGYITYLKFDLSVIPPGRAIFSAQLHLYAYEVSFDPAPGVAPLLVIDDSWQETEITGANAPDVYYKKVLYVRIAPGDNVWDVGVDVDRTYITDGVYSVQLGYLTYGVPEYYAHFGSREHPTPSMRPYLEIEYGVPFCGGTGISDDPYQICTGEQMNNIGRLPARWHQDYKLMTDISLADYSGGSYNIIGISPAYIEPRLPFTGIFDGNYHSISGFSYSSSNDSYVGLFGYVSDGTIKNLQLVSPNITDPGHDDMRYVGPIVGCTNLADISGCSVIGGTVEGQEFIGGLVGSSSASVIADCSSSASVSGASSVGGLMGKGPIMGGISSIADSYAQGAVSGDDYVGGFIGDSSDVVIVNCYSTGLVSGANNVGGFSGYNVNQFPIVDNVIGCFWDVESSGEPNSAVGTGLSTPDMQNMDTFINAGWDFVGEMENGPSDDWAMPGGGGYPILWYELPVAPALPTFAGGSGTAGDPYLIETEAQLNSIGHNPRLMDKHFRLISDLDLSGVEYYLIADRPYVFSGMFDGADHTISNILLKPGLDMSYMGFIGSLKGAGASIQNLTLADPNVVSTWGWGVGSITGINENGTITNCHAVNTNVMGLFGVGGLVGINYSYGRISGCSATGDVSENTFMSIRSSAVGGLVGENTFWSEIVNSYARCDVSGDDCVGGLVGSNLAYGILTNCYSQGSVTGSEDDIGGLIGRNVSRTEVNYCYSSSVVTGPAGTDDVGGFVGRMGRSGREYYTACFWDSDINPDVNGIGNAIDPNVIGESTANMQTESTFTDVGWDFVGETVNGPNDIWEICEGTNYPKLSWQIPPLGDFICPDGVNFIDFSFFAGHWAKDNCGASNDCDGRDLDQLGSVDFKDLGIFVDNWLADVE